MEALIIYGSLVVIAVWVVTGIANCVSDARHEKAMAELYARQRERRGF